MLSAYLVLCSKTKFVVLRLSIKSLYSSEVPAVKQLHLPPDRPAGDDAAGPGDQQDDGPHHPGDPAHQDGH